MSIGPHSEVSGKNQQPGRLIWNIETPDVKGEFERMKTAGAIVIREPYSFEGYPDSWIATLADPDNRVYAATELGKLGPAARAALPALKRLKFDGDTFTRAAVEIAIDVR